MLLNMAGAGQSIGQFMAEVTTEQVLKQTDARYDIIIPTR